MLLLPRVLCGSFVSNSRDAVVTVLQLTASRDEAGFTQWYQGPFPLQGEVSSGAPQSDFLLFALGRSTQTQLRMT